MLLFPFHVGFIENPGITSWTFEPVAIVSVALTGFFYFRWIKKYREQHPGEQVASKGKQITFVAGLATFLLALISPIDPLGSYLLSMHMTQHILLSLVGPPLLLLGMPVAMYRAFTQLGVVWDGWRVLTRPVVAFVLFNFYFSVMHLPILYNLILRVEIIHISAHLLLMGTAILSWWPVLAPGREFGELSPGVKSLYLLAHTIPSQIVGGVITMTPTIIYQEYANAPFRLWGMSLKTDQEIGGLIMWTFMGAFYLAVASVAFYRWASDADSAERRRIESARARAKVVP